MTRRVVPFACLAQLLFGIACVNEGEEPDPSVVELDYTFVEGLDAPTCFEEGTPGPKLVVAGKPFSWRVRAVTEITSCTCKYTETPQWGCDRQKVCESSYDLGAENPSTCETVSTGSVEVLSVEITDDGGCVTTAVPAKKGIVDVTMTCPLGMHTGRVEVQTTKGLRFAELTVVANENGLCSERSRTEREAD